MQRSPCCITLITVTAAFGAHKQRLAFKRIPGRAVCRAQLSLRKASIHDTLIVALPHLLGSSSQDSQILVEKFVPEVLLLSAVFFTELLGLDVLFFFCLAVTTRGRMPSCEALCGVSIYHRAIPPCAVHCLAVVVFVVPP